ncbi:DUF4167 domain-containing protein [Azospirillum argentinense]|uniref:DUF4167 domain-containing protein n=1 Tax=Azospirillum argentinense TaxID=2970906 RepID=A0A2K1FSE4_9PROT|nr:DUF4167 domain-containing protein [Azospirillum argentinense]KAA1053707.1 hypothetical protein FH063_002675 [Azospirillum argentinense]MBK3802933.1 DUF4167 domain-containing protein [Azospirillum argentinense]PNQ95462.1 DUF4167 domain-containing protein [Azospirillum argentinense]
MPFDNPTGDRGRRQPRFGKAAQRQAVQGDPARAHQKLNGSAQQKHGQWLARAVDAERSGDAVEAETCRQHAEHWFRVANGRNEP